MPRFSVGNAFHFKGRTFYGPLRGWQSKPLHPPLTDVPVGAYVVAPILDVAAFVGKHATWSHEVYRAAGITLLIGAIFSVPTALTGLADWLKTRPGSSVRATANMHMATMLTVTALVLGDLALRFPGSMHHASAGSLILAIAIIALTTAGGALGGSLVFERGMRVYYDEEKEKEASPGASA